MRDPRLDAGGRFLVDEVPSDLARALTARGGAAAGDDGLRAAAEEVCEWTCRAGCQAEGRRSAAHSRTAGPLPVPSSRNSHHAQRVCSLQNSLGHSGGGAGGPNEMALAGGAHSCTLAGAMHASLSCSSPGG
eukprot:3941494-Alexandrium_andersonii.AAC.1